MKNTLVLLFLLSAFLCSAAVKATVRPDLTTRDGLSQGYVETMIQDSLGYMWFATPDGLNRYDGQFFKVYRHEPGGDNAIPGRLITHMATARDGDLWLSTDNDELWYYRAATDSFTGIPLPASGRIIDMVSGGDGSVLLLLPGRYLYHMTAGSKQFTHKSISLPVSASTITHLQQGRQGIVYYFTPEAIYRHKLQALPFQESDGWQAIDDRASGQDITYIFRPEGQRSAWLMGLTALSVIEDGRVRKVPYPLSPELKDKPKGVTNVLTDPAGNIWILLNRSLIKVNAEHIADVQAEDLHYQDEFGLVNYLYRDRSGLLWTSLNGRGLSTLSLLQQAFYHTCKEEVIYYILEDREGRVWTQHDLPRTYDSLAVRQRIPMTEDKLGNIWIRTGALDGQERTYSAFERIDRRGRIVQTIEVKDAPSNMPYFSNYVLFTSRDSLVWMISSNELVRMDPVTGATKVFPFIRRSNRTPEAAISAVEETEEGFFYLATAWGLVRFDPATGKYVIQGGKLGPGSRIISLEYTNNARELLWAGTRGDGLYCMDLATGKVIAHFYNGKGLEDNVIYGIISDSQGNLWLSGNSGLTCLNPRTRATTLYTFHDGLQGNEFNTFSYHTGPSGRFYFGGMNGLNAFYPEEIKRHNTPPPVQISDIIVNGKLLPAARTSSGSELVLDHDQNTLSFQYAALDYHDPSQNQYRIMLDGGSSSWLDMGNRTNATFANLAPGQYTLIVQGSTGSGAISRGEARLSFTIKSPWYANPVAYSLFSIAGMSIVISYIHLRTRRIRLAQRLRMEEKEARHLKKLDALKTNFVSNIVHEFRTPLTLMLSPLEQVMESLGQQHREELQLSHRSGQKVLALVNRLLDLAKLESGSMDVNWYHGDIEAFIDRLCQSFLSRATRLNISLTTRLHMSDPGCLFDPAKTEAIISNLLSNALKHTPDGGSVSLELHEVSHMIQIVVSDTGSGIPLPAQPHIFDRFYQGSASDSKGPGGTGIGLALCRELTRLLGGEITFTSQEGKGTTFSVTLPLHRRNGGRLYATYHTPQEEPHRPEETYLPRLSIQAPAHTHILIIEDNEELRLYLQNLLSASFNVTVATNGSEGLSIARDVLPDMIITDLMMPEMDGLEVCRHLKQDRLTSHIPVIMLTAKTALESKLQGLEAGAEVYLTKPFSLMELQLRIQNALTLRTNLKEYFTARESPAPGQEDDVPSGVSPLDIQFISDIDTVIRKYVDSPDLSAQTLVEQTGMSKSQIYRKLKALTGLSINHYIRKLRLEVSCDLLRNHPYTLKEITYKCGFSSQSYFNRSFKEVYDCTPGEYRKKHV